ncbi:PHP domain-containing protein [Rhodococcus rhodnii]|uniref:Polymerase/histidinol phosphatase N-terminal domain-containing protein n=2 Tax=Rhodococcus rhodnii TaxID=38312 RepID=R7WPY9_9NOCA|nr:PHP domain-containing protein [Rhodococcus rhodnii]EOM77382.1 hypothetical protein Rrhod_1251 [Rhodococcus rhodnii LMG 5362]TXG91747.1 PHP domain-containing protein [Rhodococcus rhodnii]
MRIDLHAHSSESDGTDSPARLVAAAAEAGLDVVAITDHDTTAGWEAAAAARPDSLTLVRGMEMSCAGRGEDGFDVPVHLLAYLFDPAAPAFAAERERLRAERVDRIRAMATRMRSAGLAIDPDRILAEAGPSVGRPHLARALIDAGVVDSVADAFRGPLSTSSEFYVDKIDTPLADAVAMVADAGGVAVVAHPRARSRGRLMDLAQIAELVPDGLRGIEVHHPDHSAADVAVLDALADELDLVVTGSSDYHGSNKTIPLGAFTTAPEQYARLVDAATGTDVLGPVLG